MPNYLTKEEIKQWRGSLEKITLEEFAARLGKEVEESKSTNDVVDIVMTKGTSSTTNIKARDGFSEIAQRAFKREQQISHTPFSIRKNDLIPKKEEQIKSKSNKAVEKKIRVNEIKADMDRSTLKNNNDNSVKKKFDNVVSKDIQIKLKKSLTDREQLVFDYLIKNVGKTVFAKDLAKLLDLPRDYVYKYIKNLRAKIDGNNLQNVPSGGFMLTE